MGTTAKAWQGAVVYRYCALALIVLILPFFVAINDNYLSDKRILA